MYWLWGIQGECVGALNIHTITQPLFLWVPTIQRYPHTQFPPLQCLQYTFVHYLFTHIDWWVMFDWYWLMSDVWLILTDEWFWLILTDEWCLTDIVYYRGIYGGCVGEGFTVMWAGVGYVGGQETKANNKSVEVLQRSNTHKPKEGIIPIHNLQLSLQWSPLLQPRQQEAPLFQLYLQPATHTQQHHFQYVQQLLQLITAFSQVLKPYSILSTHSIVQYVSSLL